VDKETGNLRMHLPLLQPVWRKEKNGEFQL
jgi:hypothetical protein